MTKRYEIARSSDDPPLMLIFLEGSWDDLPFEIRLLRPWYESEFCDRHSLTATQRFEIAARGYCIADQRKNAAAADPVTRNSSQI